MRRTGLCLILIFMLTAMPQILRVPHSSAFGQGVAENEATKEDAELLFEEALDFQKKGNMPQAIASYAKAMRIDRSILAYDDNGLIEALRDDCLAKLKDAPDDVKVRETLAFVYAVCYSDYAAAIESYEKVYDLVKDEQVKERTAAVIERLKATAGVQNEYQAQISAELRDERLKSWSEMERNERFGEETAMLQEKSERLAEAYKMKDSLKNRVPQLEAELKELQEEYDKANRLFYTVTDKGLYERRRRRLKDQIAEKEQEVSAARDELSEIEEESGSLERELSAIQKKEDESPVRSYEEYPSEPVEVDTEPQAPVDSTGSSEVEAADEEDYEQQPLPEVENPDFPDSGDEDVSDQEKLDELINNL